VTTPCGHIWRPAGAGVGTVGPQGDPGSWGAGPKGSSASRHARRSEDVRNLEAARERASEEEPQR